MVNSSKEKLLNFVRTEVRIRLEQSLHDRVDTVPDRQTDPNPVEFPWEVDLEIGDRPSFRLPKNTTLDEVLDRPDIAGRLLILGAPGSGTTTMLLKLAQKLVEDAQNDRQKPIPVLLNLSSWKKDNLSLKQWAIASLKFKYGVRQDIAKKWMKEGAILPLIDGLDELTSQQQETCIQKINEFLKPETWADSLVVCSRGPEDRLDPSAKLGLNASLILQPLTIEQIRDYVLKTEGQQLWDSIENDADLMRDDSNSPGLARIPLLLNIIVLSCSEISFARWQQCNSFEERRSYLFDAYIRKMLGRPGWGQNQVYKDEDTLRCLGWLARKLIEQNQTEFFIENLHSSWLTKSNIKRIYSFICGLTYGLIMHLMICLALILKFLNYDSIIYDLQENIIGILTFVLIGTLIFGLPCGIFFGVLDYKTTTIENFYFSKKSLTEGLIYGIVTGLIYGRIVGRTYGPTVGLIGGLVVSAIVGMILVLIYGLRGSEIEPKTFPNQGIFLTLKNIPLLTILLYPFSILLYYVGLWYIAPVLWESGPSTELLHYLYVGLYFAPTIGLLGGGIAVIQHFSLRLYLWYNKLIPWNYAKFLDDATHRLFLQRVGGGYRFIHHLLRRHFAETYGS